jgi:hypothetical protein
MLSNQWGLSDSWLNFPRLAARKRVYSIFVGHRGGRDMKRIGYVGLSTPSFYDYRNPASRAPSDDVSSPNPILEGAFGSLLLYDELWFLCRSLCPENMRSLHYIKFLDELNQIPEFDPHWVPAPNEMFDVAAINAFRKSSDAYIKVKKQAKVYWNAAADNHTHNLKIGTLRLSGSSWNIKNVVFDMMFAQRLDPKVELITNSFTSCLFKTEASVRDRIVLSEVLVLDSVPQFLTPSGPYHSCVEEVRESAYLEQFRHWIQTEALSASTKDVKDVKAEVEAKLAESQRKIFLKYLDPKGSYKSLAETMIGIGLDALVPGASPVKDLIGQLSKEKEKQGLRWQGFILEARSKVPRARRRL